MQDSYNIIPVTLAVALHALVFSSLVAALDWQKGATPAVPLAIKATLVTEDYEPPQIVRAPEPEPELPQPDPEEAARIEAEEQKRIEDERIEQQRIELEQQREREERAQREAEDKARREREAEAELERIRAQREAERQADIERQRRENEAAEQALLAQQRQDLLDEEQRALAAQDSPEMAAYQLAMIQKVQRNWARPGTARDDLECIVDVEQIPGGEVINVRVSQCNGDEIVRRSVEAAVLRASPLPQPENPLLFLRRFQFRFTNPD